MVMINAEINELKKKPVCFYFLFTEKLNCSAKKTLHKLNKHLNFRKILHHFLLYNVRHGHLTASLDAFLLLQCWCGHIFYDALQKSND